MFTYEFIQDRNYTLIHFPFTSIVLNIVFICSIDGELQLIPIVFISTKKSQKILYF